MLSFPLARPMPTLGPRCQELRIRDSGTQWRIIIRVDSNAIVIVEVFAKKTRRTPSRVLRNGRRRLREYDGEKDGH
jgi:phage-related protein